MILFVILAGGFTAPRIHAQCPRDFSSCYDNSDLSYVISMAQVAQYHNNIFYVSNHTEISRVQKSAAPCFSYRRSKANEEHHFTLPVFLLLLCCWTPRHCRKLLLAINKYRRTVSSSGGFSGLQLPARAALVHPPLQILRDTLSPRVAPYHRTTVHTIK